MNWMNRLYQKRHIEWKVWLAYIIGVAKTQAERSVTRISVAKSWVERMKKEQEEDGYEANWKEYLVWNVTLISDGDAKTCSPID